MRIIDETPSREVAKQTVCRNCGVTLEYVPADVKRDYRTDYTGGTDAYDTINCLKCGVSITVGLV